MSACPKSVCNTFGGMLPSMHLVAYVCLRLCWDKSPLTLLSLMLYFFIIFWNSVFVVLDATNVPVDVWNSIPSSVGTYSFRICVIIGFTASLIGTCLIPVFVLVVELTNASPCCPFDMVLSMLMKLNFVLMSPIVNALTSPILIPVNIDIRNWFAYLLFSIFSASMNAFCSSIVNALTTLPFFLDFGFFKSPIGLSLIIFRLTASLKHWFSII